MKKCKHCKGTDFGVVVKEIQKAPFRMTDGKAVGGPLADPEKITEIEVNYCFGCNKPITEEDLIENEICTVCGKEVEETTNGKCPECEAQAKAYARMNKDELIMMIMKNQNANVSDTESQEGESTTEKKQESKKPSNDKQQEVSSKVDKVAKEQLKEETKKEQGEDKTPKQVDTTLNKPEKEIKEDLKVNDEDAEDLNKDLFPEEGDVPDIGTASSGLSDEADILSQIDNIDVSALNIMKEDIEEAI